MRAQPLRHKRALLVLARSQNTASVWVSQQGVNEKPGPGDSHLICNHEFIEECVNVLDFIHQGSGLFKFFLPAPPLSIPPQQAHNAV